MATYLDEKELLPSYTAAVEEARKHTDRFDEYDRLAANGIRPNLPKNYPEVNDGTLSSMLDENVKRVFQKLYSGKFSAYDRSDAWFDELVNVLWTRYIIPGANTDADFFTKFWNLMYRAEKYGSNPFFCFFSTRDDYTGGDWVIDNPRDVYLEPGKVSADSSNYLWRNSYMTKLDLQNLIEQAQAENADAAKTKRDSFNTWDVELLQQYVNAGPGGKDDQNKNRTEKQRQIQSPYFTFATAYHKGFNAPFLTIIPSMTGQVVRTRENENPSGATPIGFAYHTQDLESPYGRGLVQKAGHTQNVLDYFKAADVLATQMGVEPPTKIKGSEQSLTGFVESSIIYAPRQKWRVGNGDANPVDLSNGVYDQLQSRMSNYKTDLMNQLGIFDTSVSSTVGNPQFSKTPAGVANLNTRTNVNDNFFSRSGAAAFKQLAERLMNIHLANMEGTEPYGLLEDEVERLQKAGWAEASKNITLVWKNLRGKMCFEVDDPTSINDEETQGLKEVITTLTENNGAAVSLIEGDGDYRVDLGEAYRQYFGKFQLPNLDKIIVPVDSENSEAANGGPAPQPTQPGAANGQGQATPAGRAPSSSINYKDAPPDIQAQMEAAEGWRPSPTHAPALQAAMQPPQPPAPATPAPTAPQAPQHLPITPENAAQLSQEHDATKQQYGVDEHGAAIIMAARRAGVPEAKIAEGMAAARANATKGNQQ